MYKILKMIRIKNQIIIIKIKTGVGYILKIKSLKSFNKEFEISGLLDEKSRILFIEKNKSLKDVLEVTYNLNHNNIELIGERNEQIIINGLQYLTDDNNAFIYKISLIGINCKDFNEMIDLTEVVARIWIHPNKYINYSGKDITFTLKDVGKVIINNKYIKIKKGNFREFDINNLILKVMELLSIILGEFPEIECFEYKSLSKGVVRKYFDVNGFINTDLIFSLNNKRMGDFFYINGKKLKKAFMAYCELMEKDDIQFKTYFMSQSYLSYYSDYRLSYLIQAIEGFSKFAFNNELKEYSNKKIIISNLNKNGAKNINIDRINEEDSKYQSALEDVKKYINDKFSGDILTRLEGFFEYNENAITLNNILEYWLENDEFVMNIFMNEIINENPISKDKLLKITINERNRISHSMKKSKKKKYFSSHEKILYIYKYTLMFRYIVLKKIGITLTDKIKLLNIKSVNNYADNS